MIRCSHDDADLHAGARARSRSMLPRLRRARLALTLTLASLVCAAPAVAAPPSSARPAVTQGAVFLVGGELHVGDGQVIRDCVVEIVDGRFGRIRQGSRVPLPAGARTIDVAGKVLTPGLIAADSSLGLVEIDLEPSTRDDGVEAAGPVRAAHDAALAVHEDSSLIQVQAIEGVTTAAVAPSGGLLSGQVAWIDLLHGDPELVARARVAIDGSLGQAYGGSRSATIAKLTEVLEDARLYPGRRAAYERGDYKTAYDEWLPLALAGEAEAQFNIGILHDHGQGVPEDDAEAAKRRLDRFVLRTRPVAKYVAPPAGAAGRHTLDARWL